MQGQLPYHCNYCYTTCFRLLPMGVTCNDSNSLGIVTGEIHVNVL